MHTDRQIRAQGLTNKQLRERCKTLGVGEDQACGNGWWLQRMDVQGRRYFAYWFIYGQESNNTSKLANLTECLKHMGR